MLGLPVEVIDARLPARTSAGSGRTRLRSRAAGNPMTSSQSTTRRDSPAETTTTALRQQSGERLHPSLGSHKIDYRALKEKPWK